MVRFFLFVKFDVVLISSETVLVDRFCGLEDEVFSFFEFSPRSLLRLFKKSSTVLLNSLSEIFINGFTPKSVTNHN